MGIFERDEGDDEVAHSIRRELFILGYKIFKQMRADLEIVASLLKGDAVYLLGFDLLGNEIGVDLHDIVVSFSLAFENFKSFRLIAGGDHAVRHLALNHESRGDVADIGQGYEITEGAHSVRSAGTRISATEGGLVKPLDVIHEASLFQRIRKRNANGSGGWADMFEGCGGRKA